jgi:translation elongation factor EF-4
MALTISMTLIQVERERGITIEAQTASLCLCVVQTIKNGSDHFHYI